MKTRWYPITGEFRLEMDVENLSLSHETEQEIEKIWDEENTKRKRPFTNGEMFYFRRWEKESCLIGRTDYRHYLAQIHRPELFPEKIFTMAVSGLTRYGDSVLLGLRAPHVTQYPGYWELAPSGGFSAEALTDGRFSYQEQLYLELLEETGISRTSVSEVSPIALVQDHGTFLVELALEVTLCDDRGIQQRTDEYQELKWVPIADVPRFASAHKILPFSADFLRYKGFLS